MEDGMVSVRRQVDAGAPMIRLDELRPLGFVEV
jgi:hypothetical protein